MTIRQLLEETNASGVAQADYIYLNDRPVAVLNGSTLYYLHDDRLGTPQLATDSNQTVAWQASYDAFGQASVSGTVTQNLRLRGQYFDLESGWNHNGFRDYLPSIGRYAEPDPLGRLGSGNNLYVYVGDDPIDFIDPLGLCATRKLDPNSQECKELAKKIDNLAKDIIKRDQELATNPRSLPEFAPPGSPLRASVDGHRILMQQQIDNLGAAADLYNNKCGGGQPPLSPVGGLFPAPTNSPSSISPRAIIVGVLVVGGAVALAPETGGLSLAFAF